MDDVAKGWLNILNKNKKMKAKMCTLWAQRL